MKTHVGVRLVLKAYKKILTTRKLRGTNRVSRAWKKAQKKVKKDMTSDIIIMRRLRAVVKC